MTIVPIQQDGFVAGEIGPYMSSRASLPYYTKSAQTLENVIPLSQGPVQFRKGFQYLATFSGVSADAINMLKFSFNASEEYIVAAAPSNFYIYRNGVLKATVSSPYTASDVNDLRYAQYGDTMLIFHPSYAVRQLVRNASDTDWALSSVSFTNVPWFRHNQVSTLTSSATSGTITLTLDQAPGWKAGHAQSGQIKYNSGIATISNFPTVASGGTAYSSAGTPANAFDNNAGTLCSAGVDGWIGYGFTGSTTVRLVGIKSDTTISPTVVFETANNSSFTSATTRATLTIDLTAGTLVWFDVTSPSADTYFRVRVTSGATFTVQDMYLATGLVANATVTTGTPATTATKSWYEWAWSPARGYPRCGTFNLNRLVIGGTRDAPESIFGSNSGDFYNFDNVPATVTDSSSFAFTINTELVHTIRDIKAKRNLNIFTSDGEFEMKGSDAAGITPTSVRVNQQTSFGICDIQVVEADDQLHFFTRDFKQLLSFDFDLSRDKYVADNKTILGHHLFTDGKEPWGMCVLRSYADTQATLIFASREDGTLCVLNTDKDAKVLAWARWITDGVFRDVQTATITDSNGKIKQALFAIVKRTINGTDKVFLEMLTEEDAYVDCWHSGTHDPAQATWSGLTALAGATVTVVGDGLVVGNTNADTGIDVDGSGSFTLPDAVSEVVAGLSYTGTVKPQPLRAIANGQAVKGKMMRKLRAIADVIDTKSLTVDSRAVDFRQFGNDLLDEPLATFTGTKEQRLAGVGKDISVTLTITEPLPCTIAAITTEVKVGK